MRHSALHRFVERRRRGVRLGMASFCCASELVIEALVEQTMQHGGDLLIEATSNQVNQFGGYSGLTPEQFLLYVKGMAHEQGLDPRRLILGGDHLGPLPWTDLPAAEAMKHARKLVEDFVMAGYLKIHLDTSMYLGGDDREKKLDDEIIAQRSAYLYRACLDAFEKRRVIHPESERPLFVIGSEVPPAGGSSEDNEELTITRVEDLKRTLQTHKKYFGECGSWEDIIAVVVQPGVEFSNHNVHVYDRKRASDLRAFLDNTPEMMLECHSTDYQPVSALREMVMDGISIIKVGPALTFAQCEALTALCAIEKEMVPNEARRSCFLEILHGEMDANDKHWAKYYRGTPAEIAFAKKFSLFDRRRYYLKNGPVREATKRLFANLDSKPIPRGLVSQFLPLQYKRLLQERRSIDCKSLVKDYLAVQIEEYDFSGVAAIEPVSGPKQKVRSTAV